MTSASSAQTTSAPILTRFKAYKYKTIAYPPKPKSVSF
jgi:hypothetical protein